MSSTKFVKNIREAGIDKCLVVTDEWRECWTTLQLEPFVSRMLCCGVTTVHSCFTRLTKKGETAIMHAVFMLQAPNWFRCKTTLQRSMSIQREHQYQPWLFSDQHLQRFYNIDKTGEIAFTHAIRMLQTRYWYHCIATVMGSMDIPTNSQWQPCLFRKHSFYTVITSSKGSFYSINHNYCKLIWIQI